MWSKPSISQKTKIVNLQHHRNASPSIRFWNKASCCFCLWCHSCGQKKILTLTHQTPNSYQLAVRALWWFGHVIRLPAEAPARILFNFDPPEHSWKRPCGRPQFRLRDSLTHVFSMVSIDLQEGVILAQDRLERRWRVTSLSLHWTTSRSFKSSQVKSRQVKSSQDTMCTQFI